MLSDDYGGRTDGADCRTNSSRKSVATTVPALATDLGARHLRGCFYSRPSSQILAQAKYFQFNLDAVKYYSIGNFTIQKYGDGFELQINYGILS